MTSSLGDAPASPFSPRTAFQRAFNSPGTPTPSITTNNTSSPASAKAEFTKKEQIRCLLCGGKDCSKCGLEAYKQLVQPPPAIAQLHSHWINDSIIAMQRPNDIAFENGALKDMVTKKVTAVFNLTEPGEHPYCGTGNLAISGFPYSPEKLMHVGIKHFNFSWQDMTVPSLQLMFDLVNIAVVELTNGGKIAVHCHAGFGRTGLAIACILIAKDLLEASQVIQFIRLRRPGSIQTTAQQQFIYKFERAMYQRMQVFPVIEHVKKTSSSTSRSAATSTSLHLKTIKGSVQDQQHFLTPTEQANHRYKYIHKVVHYTTTAMKRLAHEHFLIACLAITGLTRLTIKRNLDLEADETMGHSSSGGVGGGGAAPGGGVGRGVGLRGSRMQLKKKNSFMVATNSLSESGEENILTELKMEVNGNKWSRLFTIADVVSADLARNPDSVRTMNYRENTSSFSNLRKGMSSYETSGADFLPSMQTQEETNTTPVIPILPSPHAHALGTSSSQHAFSQMALEVVEEGEGEANTTSAEGLRTTSVDEEKVAEGHGLSLAPQAASHAITTTPAVSSTITAVTTLHPHPPPHAKAQSEVGIGKETEKGNTNNNNNDHGNNSNGGGGGLGAGLRSLSLSRLRANSLRVMSDTELAKSKRMSVNLVAQLLLDWMETRQNALFSEEVVAQLGQLWTKHGHRYFTSTRKAAADEGGGYTRRSFLSPSHSRRGSNSALSNSHLPSLDSPSGREGGGIRAPIPDLEPFTSSVKTSPTASELTAEISNCLHSRMDRYGLEMLNSLVSMYKRLRKAGREMASNATGAASPQNLSSSRSSTNSSVGIGLGGGSVGVGSNSALSFEEYEALEALVGLRLAIACMHARKQFHGLIRQRALVIDLVKVFLLKSTNSDLVIINNITFSEESYEHVKQTIGEQLIFQLDVVFRTLRLLTEEDWKSPVDQHAIHATVHWRPHLLAPLSSSPGGGDPKK